MKIIATDFEGLLVIEPQYYKDERGAFYESWREVDYKSIGIHESFLQDNVSVSVKNVLRGLHYQKDQGQLVTVTFGKIFDVAVDIRPHSAEFGKYFFLELSGDKPQQIYVPPGFAHGFCVLSELAIINYKCSQNYNPAQEGGIVWNDPEINIKWPIDSPIISQKDQKLGVLSSLR